METMRHVRPAGDPAPPGTDDLQRRLGYRWSRPALLLEALTHSSYGNARGLPHNERLEFLGDSVLDLACANWLMGRHPDKREGFMAQRREGMVCAVALAERARELGVGRSLLLEVRDSALRDNPGVLADALEALVGSLWLDCGRLLSTVTERLLTWGVLR